MNSIHLFVNKNQVSEEVKKHLAPEESVINIVKFHAYAEIGGFLNEQAHKKNSKKIWFSNSASYGIYSRVPEGQRHFEVSPVAVAKSMKNPVEIEGFIQCHVRDGAALCQYLAWLEKNVSNGEVNEVTGADRLEKFRSKMPEFFGLSFPTISSVGPNAANIHYHPNPKNCRTVTTEEVYLVDSGGQYKDGTTDVTRTVHFGIPKDFERECFTRVLKGNISLNKMIFPNKLVGNRLDSFARASLWQAGLDYMHGTSHGVGSYLNVHEGPMGISWRKYPDDPGLQENMVLSNEPGYYQDGQFGIRIENLVRIVKADTKHQFKDNQFLTFETLTLVPIQKKMIDPNLLTADEVDYINNYHEECREKVGTFLRNNGDQETLSWLIKETEPIG